MRLGEKVYENGCEGAEMCVAWEKKFFFSEKVEGKLGKCIFNNLSAQQVSYSEIFWFIKSSLCVSKIFMLLWRISSGLGFIVSPK